MNVRKAEVFLGFKAHYGFQITFCNHYSGHEKVNVENMVGYAAQLVRPFAYLTDVQALIRELCYK